MKYNSFYFLHVPKTGGRFLKKYILDPISEEFAKNGIIVYEPFKIPNTNRKNRHVGWRKEISDSTYILSCIREPVSWICSFFTHVQHQINGFLDNENEAKVIKNLPVYSKDLFSWLDQHPNFNNYQSKNFILGADPEISNINKEIDIFQDTNQVVDKDFLYNRLKRVDLLIRQNDLKNMDYNILIEKIESDMGMKIDYRVSKDILNDYYSNNSSKILYDSLNNFDKHVLSTVNGIDLEIYNNDNIFWSTK